MIVSVYKDIMLFCTPFTKEFNLVQKFRGVTECNSCFNNPVDITEAGLINVEKLDYWHIDIPFSVSNDEAPAFLINGKWLGGNHGFPDAVSLYTPNHNKTVADIGSLWKDAEETKWMLLSVGEDTLTFISENIGKNSNEYAFKNYIAAKLIYLENGVHKSQISADGEMRKALMQPIIRHKMRRAVAYKNGKERVINCTMDCEYAKIYEEYEIINPVSMVEMIYKNRPENGYTAPINKAVGEPMINVNIVYHIKNDGTVLCDFTYDRLSDLKFTRCMGAMFQEKLDSFGGGVFRYIPKILPFREKEGVFDFSNLTATAPGAFPQNTYVTAEKWENPLSPPDRILDCFRDTDGNDRIGFACGYLPLYDGAAEIRAENTEAAIHIVNTRKGYPFFMDGKEINTAKGIAYKKYFEIKDGKAFYYTVDCDGYTYLYIDIFEKTTLNIPAKGSVRLYEKSDAVSYTTENDCISVFGDKGYAVFIYEKE